MNIEEQYAALEDFIDRVVYDCDVQNLIREIKDFRDSQDVVTCMEGDDCICQRFDLACDALKRANFFPAVSWLTEALDEFTEAIQERIKDLEKELETANLEEATYQADLEMITRLETIIAKEEV